MLTPQLRERIRALKSMIPDETRARADVVIDLRNEPVVDLTDTDDDRGGWIQDERVVDMARRHADIPQRGLGAVPPTANPVFVTLDAPDRELAHFIAAGMSDAEIAAALDVNPGSIELAVRSLLSLTGYTTRAEIMIGWHAG